MLVGFLVEYVVHCQGVVQWGGRGISPLAQSPPPYHFREMLCMHEYAWAKIALSLTSTSLRDLLRDKIIVPKSISSTSEKNGSRSRAHMSCWLVHVEKYKPNFDTLRIWPPFKMKNEKRQPQNPAEFTSEYQHFRGGGGGGACPKTAARFARHLIPPPPYFKTKSCVTPWLCICAWTLLSSTVQNRILSSF